MPEVVRENSWVIHQYPTGVYIYTRSPASTDELFRALNAAGVPTYQQGILHALAKDIKQQLCAILQNGAILNKDGSTEKFDPASSDLEEDEIESLKERGILRLGYSLKYHVHPEQISRVGYQRTSRGAPWFDIYDTKAREPANSHFSEMMTIYSDNIVRDPKYQFLLGPRYLVKAVAGEICRESGMGEVS